MIPVEPMYMIWNLGMSEDFGEVDIDNLPFPSYMMVDHIRVYQRPETLKVGCSPPDKPTSQWINCHKDLYRINKKDDVLFGTCTSGGVEKVSGGTKITLVVGAVVAVAMLAIGF
jgi:Beta-glucan synthesis-associated protein SKN1/KRE6/Sbg1